MRRRSEFFLQPLESRRFLSGSAPPGAEHAPAPDERAGAGATHVSSPPVEEQVAQLRSALSEMAERMAQFEKLRRAASSS
jgi:hypothetical protein